MSRRGAATPGLLAALESIRGAIDLEAMRQANKRVDVDRWPVRRAADELMMKINRP